MKLAHVLLALDPVGGWCCTCDIVRFQVEVGDSLHGQMAKAVVVLHFVLKCEHSLERALRQALLPPCLRVQREFLRQTRTLSFVGPGILCVRPIRQL